VREYINIECDKGGMGVRWGRGWLQVLSTLKIAPLAVPRRRKGGGRPSPQNSPFKSFLSLCVSPTNDQTRFVPPHKNTPVKKNTNHITNSHRSRCLPRMENALGPIGKAFIQFFFSTFDLGRL
jgi:hypothetical protein